MGVRRSDYEKELLLWDDDEPALLELVTQAEYDEGCGQAALATAAGAPMQVSVRAVGRGDRTRGTDLIQAAAALGLVCTSKGTLRWSKRKPPPPCALVLYRWEEQKLGHWVLYHRGYVYDPDPDNPGEPVRVTEYVLCGARPTSYVPLDPDSLQSYRHKRHRIGGTSRYRLQYSGAHRWKLTITAGRGRPTRRLLTYIDAASYQRAVARAVVWILRATGEL